MYVRERMPSVWHWLRVNKASLICKRSTRVKSNGFLPESRPFNINQIIANDNHESTEKGLWPPPQPTPCTPPSLTPCPSSTFSPNFISIDMHTLIYLLLLNAYTNTYSTYFQFQFSQNASIDMGYDHSISQQYAIFTPDH